MVPSYELAPWIISSEHPSSSLYYVIQNNLTRKRFRIKKEDWPNGHANGLSKRAVDFLVAEKVLIEKGNAQNELERNHFFLKHGYATDEQIATLIPTYACHFNCGYCYNKNIRDTKSEKGLPPHEMAAQLIPYYQKSPAPKWVLHVIGGGEPLLVSRYIAEVSTLIRTAAGQGYADFELDVITNGHLLYGENLACLQKAGLKKVRVTLDPRHDTARPLMDGGGTFKQIFGNLLALPPDVEIQIGSNVPYGEMDAFAALLETLSPLKNRITDFTANLLMPQLNNAPAAISAHESTMYGTKEVDFLENLISMIDMAGFQRKNHFPRIECEAGRDCEKLVINMLGETTFCAGLDGITEYKTEFKEGVLQGELEGKICKDATWKTHCVHEGKPCAYIPLCHTGCRLISVSKGLGWWTPNCEMLFLDRMNRYELRRWGAGM